MQIKDLQRTTNVDSCDAGRSRAGDGVSVIVEKQDTGRPLSLDRSRLRSLLAPLFLGLLCLLIYNANFRQIGAGDTLPARYLPLNIWRHGTLELDSTARWVAHGHSMVSRWDRSPADHSRYFEPWAYWMIRSRHNHLVSIYPVVAPILVAPLYLPAVAYLYSHGWQQPEVDRVAEVMEKLSASILATIASILMYFILRRGRIGGGWSFALALAFAFGTNTWMISSQALWQHGAGEVLIALALLLALSAATPAWLAALGAVSVGIAANRPPDALIAGAILLYVLWINRRSAAWLLAGAAVPLALLLYYNVGVIGNVAGGYGMVKTSAAAYFRHSVWSGAAGLLVSPARGLLIFSPFFFFVPFGLKERLRSPSTRVLAIVLSAVIVVQLLLYSRVDWRAGTSWGPRYLTNLLPIIVWMLAPAPLVLRAFGRSVLILSVIVSTLVQAIGAFWYTGKSDGAIFAGDPASMSGAWNFANVPFISELRQPRPAGELLCQTGASINRIDDALLPMRGGTLPVLRPRTLLEGSAIAGGAAPARLIALIDGIVIGSTGQFLPPPNVDGSAHASSTFGWRISANMQGVQPGERMLQLGVQIRPRSDIRIVREQRVIAVSGESPPPAQATGAASDVDAMAARAISGLRSRQSPDGYWLTSYTAAPRFESPQLEMNTFLTAMLVDFLSPLSRQRGLDDVVKSARQHLGAQIENNGLVRYHGRPDGPTIGRLGCVITPDADDTALAWRLAGPGTDDLRRQRMLNELARYRDGRGLYRTWLAPRDRYQCLDPGSDPNPADATIQLHVYMMLRELDPSAAADLCKSLQRHINDDDVWVYYANAPLVPFLRAAEVRQQGCAIPLQSDRLSHAAAGQEIWAEVARRLISMTTSPPQSNDRRSTIDLLARIGRNNFAELRRTPPLLYHNDLTASVSRYYWSEDFGYALWLRLYDTVGAGAQASGRNSQ